MRGQHTPGPWKYEYDTYNDRYLLRGKTSFGHFVGWSADGVTNEEEDVANADLIAAAPDLLAACETLIGPRVGARANLEAAQQVAREAIAKAKGRPS